MHTIKTSPLALSALALAALAAAPAARASWLDLADGTYDVALSCIVAAFPCATDIHGTMTISGTGASAFDFTVDNQHFVGDPIDGIASGATFHNEFSRLDLTPNISLALGNDLDISNSFGLPDHWWVYCRDNSPNGCVPDTNGGWTATLTRAAPEPETVALFGFGLAALGIARRRRR